jgi:hypothetical protein
MNHYDEHILELYVLGAPMEESQAREITSHLEKCSGCSALVSEMQSFYAEASAEVKNRTGITVAARTDVARRQNGVEPFQDNFAQPASPPRRMPMGRVRYFVYRHPVIASGSLFSFGAAVVLALSMWSRPALKDTKPESAYLNVEMGRMEILNKSKQVLWEYTVLRPSVILEQINLFNTVPIQVADIDHDGSNEVITCLPVDGQSKSPDYKVRVIDAGQNIRFEKSYVEQVHYLNRRYGNQFGPMYVLVRPLPGAAADEFFVGANNVGRSPFIITRYSGAGDELGQYWHFGNLVSSRILDVNRDGKEEMVLMGINDTRDSVHEEFPVVVIIDPSKLIGRSKSALSPGFQLPTSDAELYYIALSTSDIARSLRRTTLAQGFRIDADGSFRVDVQANFADDPIKVQFEYTFSKDLVPLEVKPSNATVSSHARLIADGKLKGKLDNSYLENLKNGIRFWDGREWRKETVRIDHSLLSGEYAKK